MALASDPALLVLDEPTTGLDATVEADVLTSSMNFAVNSRHRSCSSATILASSPRCATTSACSMPDGWSKRRRPGYFQRPAPSLYRRPAPLPAAAQPQGGGTPRHHSGFLPSPGTITTGCVFASRCVLADDRCRAVDPAFFDLGHRSSKCHYHDRAQQIPLASEMAEQSACGKEFCAGAGTEGRQQDLQQKRGIRSRR